MSIFTVAFWRAAGERAIKSAAQGTALTLIGAGAFDALDADWQTIGGGALGMAVLSILTSIGSDALTDGAGPSLTDAEVLPRDTTEFAKLVDQQTAAVNAMTAQVDGLAGKVASGAKAGSRQGRNIK